MTSVRLLAILAAASTGAALGFFAGSAKSTSVERGETHGAADPFAAATRTGFAASSPAPSTAATPAPAASRFHQESDSAQTLARLRAETNPNRRRAEFDDLCASLDVAGLQAFLAAAERKFTVLPAQAEIVRRLMARWAEIDAPGAAEHALAVRAGRGDAALPAVMRIWARSDPAAARQWALALKNRAAREDGLSVLVSVLAENDPQAALAFVRELPVTDDKANCISSLCATVAEKNPAAAAALVSQLGSAALRQTAVERIADVWGHREPGPALAWFVENSSGPHRWESDQVAQNILAGWLRTAPEDAATFAADLPIGAARSAMISALGESWGALQPEAAAAWLQTLPKSSESHRAFGSLIGAWSRKDPAQAGAFLLAQPANGGRNDLLETLGGGWASQDAAAALAWARLHPDPVIERAVAAEALGRLAAKDLKNADSYLGQVTTPAAITAAIYEVCNQTIYGDPEGTVQWVMQRPANQPVGQALTWPVQVWAEKSPEAVGAWLNEQPASARKDTAVGAFASTLAKTDAAAAAEWAGSIGENGLRQKRVKEVVGTWAKQDAAAAAAWVERQSLAAPERQALRQALERARQK